MDIIGHTRIIQFFDQAIASGRLSHAYCLVGRAHVGKRAVALSVLSRLMQVPPEKLAVHPDVVMVARATDEKTGALKKDISMEQMAMMRGALSRSAFYGGYKAAVIDGAEHLNTVSANALLKTLEEPTDRTVIFLLAEDERHIPATILSRCQVLQMPRVKEEEMVQALEREGIDRTAAQDLARHAAGRPGLVRLWQADAEAYEAYREEIREFHSLLYKPLYEKIRVLEAHFGTGDDHIGAREHLIALLSAWSMQIRDLLQTELGQAPGARRVPIPAFLRLHETIQQAREQLRENIHPRLLIERVLIAIP